jgi:hypothetical protein
VALELTLQQMAVLEQLAGLGYSIVAFPFYESHAGVRKGNCGALLEPVPNDGMRVFGAAFYIVNGNPSVRVQRSGKSWFVFKKNEIEVTPERDAELAGFNRELSDALAGKVQ